ncbi:hypothetical protein [Endozoicomonas euniceicola]|uniref:Uncharacterized protein n=1 Tax=Endozoicomonas euniceicola TaxID=1234143 RepID=A0ABY6GYM1_9GAMM|nr:hypothetical protein [Endozoicomonas euniceicola]UYM17014.1 hypothetical protein NX720_03550 [Endozoicomonas euniceicola]
MTRIKPVYRATFSIVTIVAVSAFLLFQWDVRSCFVEQPSLKNEKKIQQEVVLVPEKDEQPRKLFQASTNASEKITTAVVQGGDQNLKQSFNRDKYAEQLREARRLKSWSLWLEKVSSGEISLEGLSIREVNTLLQIAVGRSDVEFMYELINSGYNLPKYASRHMFKRFEKEEDILLKLNFLQSQDNYNIEKIEYEYIFMTAIGFGYHEVARSVLPYINVKELNPNQVMYRMLKGVSPSRAFFSELEGLGFEPPEDLSELLNSSTTRNSELKEYLLSSQ